MVLLLDVAVTETITVTFYGFNAPEASEKIVFNGGCQDNLKYNLSKSRIDNDRNWIMKLDLPITCSSGHIRFKWSTEPDMQWESLPHNSYREIPVNDLIVGNTAGYTIYGYKPGRV